MPPPAIGRRSDSPSGPAKWKVRGSWERNPLQPPPEQPLSLGGAPNFMRSCQGRELAPNEWRSDQVRCKCPVCNLIFLVRISTRNIRPTKNA